MIHLKTPAQIETMIAGGRILSEVMEKTLARVKPGVKLSELDAFAEKEILAHGAEPSFKRVDGYKWTICGCVNDVVVHGIPTGYTIKPGDVVGIDCGVYYNGLHTDSAWTVRADGPSVRKDDDTSVFLRTGIYALEQGLAQVKPGNRIYDISRAIQTIVEGSGYGIVQTLVGHGVGSELHEDPEVPNYVRGSREHSPKLVEGLTIAVEVIYTKGDPDVVYKNRDGWTIATKDGTLSALFEATVALNAHGFLLLTNMYGASGKH